MYKDLFERAPHIESPWYIDDLDFNEHERKLSCLLIFKKGAYFSFYQGIRHFDLVAGIIPFGLE